MKANPTMPDPRPLGNVSRAVIQAITDELERSQDEFFEISLHVYAGDVPTAMQTLKEVARANQIALRALTFLLANRQKEAEEVLISAKLRRDSH